MLSSLLSGGLTGVIGSIVTNVSDYFEKRAKRKHQLEMRKLDLEEMDREYSFQKSMAAQEQEFKLDERSYDLQEKSYEHDAAAYSKGMQIEKWWLKAMMVFVDLVRGLVRPALTLFLIWLVWDTRAEVKAIMDAAGIQGNGISPEKAVATYGLIVDMILYMASMTVCWWFGTRPKKDRDKASV